MKLFRTRFCAAMPRSSASASASPSGAGSRIGAARAIDARHELVDQRAPRRRADRRQHVRLVVGVDADVAGDESPAFSSSASGFRADISMVVPGECRTGLRRSLTSSSYAALVHQRRRTRPASLSRTLKNQPAPSGSLLASDGSARSASLTSTTSPLTGM